MSYRLKGQKVIINGIQQFIIPSALPNSPEDGNFVVDIADGKLKVYSEQKTRWIILGDAEDQVFDNDSNGFSSTNTQQAIEEAKAVAVALPRFSITTNFNGTIGNNQWLGYNELLPGNQVPIVIPIKCRLKEITFSWSSTISLVGGIVTITAAVDGRYELYKNGLTAGQKVFERTFSNAGAGGISSSININFEARDIMVGKWVDLGDNPSDAAICYFFEVLE